MVSGAKTARADNKDSIEPHKGAAMALAVATSIKAGIVLAAFPCGESRAANNSDTGSQVGKAAAMALTLDWRAEPPAETPGTNVVPHSSQQTVWLIFL